MQSALVNLHRHQSQSNRWTQPVDWIAKAYSGERNVSSLNRENGVVGEQYKRRAARRSGGVLHPRWRESNSRKHH